MDNEREYLGIMVDDLTTKLIDTSNRIGTLKAQIASERTAIVILSVGAGVGYFMRKRKIEKHKKKDKDFKSFQR